MAEYIERERARREFSLYFQDSEQLVGECDSLLCYLPNADVVEVVRCCECQYWESKNSINSQGICICGEMEMNYGGEFYPFRNDFCSYGAKMDGKGESE